MKTFPFTKTSPFLLLIFSFLCIELSHAQIEIARERSSLFGIKEFGVVVNIQKPAALETEHLNVVAIRKEIVENLKSLSASILDDRTLRQSDEFPILYIHINVMEAPNYTYPFSIELDFYQPVKLRLNRDLGTIASTWNRGQVGIVSGVLLNVIAEEAVYATKQFKDEFSEVNL